MKIYLLRTKFFLIIALLPFALVFAQRPVEPVAAPAPYEKDDAKDETVIKPENSLNKKGSAVSGEDEPKPAPANRLKRKGSSVFIPTVTETDLPMSLGTRGCLSVNLPKVKAKFAEDVWKDFAKKYTGTYKKKGDEYFSDNAMVSGIGDGNTIDLYMKFTGSGENTMASLWIDLGNSFVNSRDFEAEYQVAEKIMKAFAVTVSVEQVRRVLKDKEDMQKDLENDLAKLKRKKVNLHDDIKSWENKIERAENDVSTNEAQIQSLSNSDSQRKLEKKNNNLQEDISTWKRKIRQAQTDIEINEKEQEETQGKIEEQVKAIIEIKGKLDALNSSLRSIKE